ncbi:MAG: response regulator, partial [Sphingobacteriaceae bacterium]
MMGKILNCLIVDDEEHAIDVIKHYIGMVPFLKLEAYTTSPLQALQMISTMPIDLAFLDIQMPELSGLDLVQAIGGKCSVI